MTIRIDQFEFEYKVFWDDSYINSWDIESYGDNIVGVEVSKYFNDTCLEKARISVIERVLICNNPSGRILEKDLETIKQAIENTLKANELSLSNMLKEVNKNNYYCPLK